MISNFDKLEREFDNIFDLKKMITVAIDSIEKIKLDENSAIYDDCDINEIKDIKDSKIIYIGKEILINREGGFPKFLLQFMLEGKKNNYMYEIEYSLDGEVSDDYFELLQGEESYD